MGSGIQDSDISAVHWSEIGRYDAPDHLLMKWAIENDYIIFTHDLDFGTALALTNAQKPSVIQLRTQNVTKIHFGNMLIRVLKRYQAILIAGALLVVDENKQRIKILPLKG